MALANKLEDEALSADIVRATPVRIAICGEVSSGKTSVVNALLRETVLPDLFGSEERPVMRIVTNAEAECVTVIDQDGKAEVIGSLSELELSSGIAEVRIERTDVGPIGACEILEMPPMRDGHVSEEDIARVSDCDILVWTTIGSQAWRLSEKTILDEMGDRRPKEAVLAVSRSDKFRTDEHREKLMDRMERETGDYFGARLLIGAAPKLVEASGDDDSKWAETGGQVLASVLSAAAVRVAAENPIETEGAPTATEETSAVVMLNPVGNQATEAPTSDMPDHRDADEKSADTELNIAAPKSADEQMAAFVGTLHGLIAVGSFELDRQEDAKAYFGTAEDIADFANYCKMSAETLLAIAGFGGTDPDPESEQIAMRNRLVIYQVKDNHILFLACEQSKMSAGIARTAFHRLCNLNQANLENRIAA